MADPKAMIPVVDPETGKTGYIDPKFAPEAARTGLQSATDTQLREAQLGANAAATRADLNRDYDGTLEGMVAPALAGAARGLSLGGSDVALAELGPGMRRKLLDYQDYAPVASMVGEVGAIAGASLLGDEAGVSRLPGLVSRLGAGVETATARGLGGGMLARGAGLAARGAAEGAIYSSGKAAGDAAIHNEELTSEKVVSAVGHGALFGAGANVLLGGAGAGLSRLLERESGAFTGLATKAEGVAESRSTGLGDMLQKGADVKTIKALGGSAGDLAALERNTAGGFRKVAQDIRSDVEAATGKSIGLHSRESLHEYASQRVEALGDKLGGLLKKLDDSGSGIAPDVKSFAAKVREELVAPHVVEVPPTPEAIARWQAGKGPLPGPTMMPKPGQAPIVKAAESWLGEVEGAFGAKAPTFSEWQQARIGLDKQINFASRNASPEMGALKQIRGMMEKELEVSGEAAAKNVGSAFADEYNATKSLYASVRKAQDLTERGVARQLANNSFGLGATIGGATGMATGGPIGGIAMGLAGKLIKDRGDMMAADLLHRVANMAGVQSLASKTDVAVSKGVAALLGTKAIATGAAETAGRSRSVAAPLGVALSGDLHKDFDKVRSAAIQLSTNPVQLTERVAKALGPQAAKSPAFAQAVTNTMLGDVAYLNSRLPPRRTDEFTLQPHLQPETRASDAEKHEYLMAAKALDDPTIMLRQAKDGSLTPITVEAIKERRPEMYAEMREQILQSISTSTTELPYDRRVSLGILLDSVTDQTLAPDYVRDIQATYTASDKAGVEPPSPQSMALDVSSSLMTASQDVGSGGQAR